MTYHELGLLNLLQHMCESCFDVIPCDSFLHGRVANSPLTFLIECDDTLQHANLVRSTKAKSKTIYTNGIDSNRQANK